jgi:hypothetical protein
MNWADAAIEELRAGRQAVVQPHGRSMEPKVSSGSRVLLEPAEPDKLGRGDIVLCRVGGKVYLHLVRAVQGRRFLIGNNRGGLNGWAGPAAIYGRAVEIDGRPVNGRVPGKGPNRA